MPSTLRTIVEKVATTGGTALNRSRARIMNEPVWHALGMRFWIDGAHINSQSVETDPLNNETVTDLAQGLKPAWYMSVAGSVDYAGNGWDFTPAYAIGNGGGATRMEIPASVSANIWGDGTVNQYFGIVEYVRLPASADWNPAGNILPFFNWDQQANYLAAPAMALVGQLTAGGLKQMQAVRPVTTGTRDLLTINVPAGAFGKFAQIAFWRDATGVHLRLTYDDGSASGSVVQADAVGLGNATNDFSAVIGRVGLYNGYVSFSTSGTGWKWKLYALGVENLRTSGRSFAAVITSDWAWRLAMKNAGIYA